MSETPSLLEKKNSENQDQSTNCWRRKNDTMADSETKPDATAPAAAAVTASKVSETPAVETAPVAEAPAASTTETQNAPAAAAEEKGATTTTVSTEASPIAQLWAAAQETGHPEIWGVTLADPAVHVPSQIVLQKYLNANDGDLGKAKEQLVKTLEWRAKTKPLELVKKAYSKAKFDGLGFVTTYAADGEGALEPEGREIFTWNIYGGVKSIEETFGNIEE